MRACEISDITGNGTVDSVSDVTGMAGIKPELYRRWRRVTLCGARQDRHQHQAYSNKSPDSASECRRLLHKASLSERRSHPRHDSNALGIGIKAKRKVAQ